MKIQEYSGTELKATSETFKVTHADVLEVGDVIIWATKTDARPPYEHAVKITLKKHEWEIVCKPSYDPIH